LNPGKVADSSEIPANSPAQTEQYLAANSAESGKGPIGPGADSDRSWLDAVVGIGPELARAALELPKGSVGRLVALA
jgi:hypothetical protein